MGNVKITYHERRQNVSLDIASNMVAALLLGCDSSCEIAATGDGQWCGRFASDDYAPTEVIGAVGATIYHIGDDYRHRAIVDDIVRIRTERYEPFGRSEIELEVAEALSLLGPYTELIEAVYSELEKHGRISSDRVRELHAEIIRCHKIGKQR